MEHFNSMSPSSQLPENFMSGDLISDTSFSRHFNSQDIADILNNGNQETEILTNTQHWFELDDENVEDDKRSPSNLNTSYSFKEILNDLVHDGSNVFAGKSSSNRVSSSVPIRPTFNNPSFSTAAWVGKFNFKVDIKVSLSVSSKWRYSELLQKLYTKRCESFPLEIKFDKLKSGVINITPVYTGDSCSSGAVTRCYNHSQEDKRNNIPHTEHVVQVDDPGAIYNYRDSRYSVEVPLRHPAPGEHCWILYVKCCCLSSCTGGLSRKPFSLLFTLFNDYGTEVGRQILDLKVCACPIRDCELREKKFRTKTHSKNSSVVINSTKATKRVKVDSDSTNFETISIPKEIVPDIKRFANQLMAEKYAKEKSFPLLFPGY